MKGRKNRPAGQAKTRPKVRPPRKPYADKDDRQNLQRLGGTVRSIFGLSVPVAAAIRERSKQRLG